MKLQNVIVNKKKILKYRKTGKLILSPRGRWGYRWLHQLVFNVAKNLGMVRNEVLEEPFFITVRKQVDCDNIKDLIDSALKRSYSVFDDWHLAKVPFFIVMGLEEFDDFSYAIRLEPYSFMSNIEIYNKRHTFEYRGIPVYVVPGLEGCAVLPNFNDMSNPEWKHRYEMAREKIMNDLRGNKW